MSLSEKQRKEHVDVKSIMHKEFLPQDQTVSSARVLL